jgi:hypothetical protein
MSGYPSLGENTLATEECLALNPLSLDVGATWPVVRTAHLLRPTHHC